MVRKAKADNMTRPMFLPESDWRPPKDFPDLSHVKLLGVDTETSDPNLFDMGPGFIRGDAKLRGFSVATADKAWYYPLCHEGGDNFHNPVGAKEWFKDLMANPNSDKIFHNAMYDVESLDSVNIEVAGTWRCTMVNEALIDENSKRFTLEATAERRLGSAKDQSLLEEAAAAYGYHPKADLWRMPARYVGPYAEQDAMLLPSILNVQLGIMKDESLEKVYDLESRLLKVIWAMRKQGVRIDEEKAVCLGNEWKMKGQRIISIINADAGFPVDIWSDKSLIRVYEKFHIPVPLTPKGNPSFEAGAMVATEHPTLVAIAECRKVDKMRRDFIDGFILKYSIKGRLHAQFHTTRKDDKGTRSGRFSSSNPNLQQVPARDPFYGPAIRGMFLPDEGAEWCKLDYSSQEPRLTVHFASLLNTTGAKELAAEWNRNPYMDFHMRAAEMANISRPQAKGIGLGLTYGMGKDKLAKELGVSREEADPFFYAYNNAYPFMQETATAAMELAQKRGYIRTILGRRSRFPNPDFCYKALNRAVQGSGADFMKMALVKIWEAHEIAPLLTVHDEGDYNLYDRDFASELSDIMQNAIPCVVPMVVDPEVGPNWGALQAL